MKRKSSVVRLDKNFYYKQLDEIKSLKDRVEELEIRENGYICDIRNLQEIIGQLVLQGIKSGQVIGIE